MKRMRVSFLSLMVVALIVGSGIVQDAEAEVRFDATLHTPNVRVRIGNTPSVDYRRIRGRRLPSRGRQIYRISKEDQKIARRLAQYTGVPARELLQLRRYGYRWPEIGHWLRLPRPVIRAAMRQGSWKRFLREERLLARRGVTPYRGRVVVYYDD